MLLTAAVVAIFLQIINAERNSLSKIYDFPETHVEATWRMHDDQGLVYARCNSSKLGSSKQCIVGIKFNIFENSTDESKECKLILHPETPITEISDGFFISSYGKNKIFVTWFESHNTSNVTNKTGWVNVKTSIVDIFNDCQSFQTILRVDKFRESNVTNCITHNYLFFKNNFEVIFDELAVPECIGTECIRKFDIYKFDSHTRKLSGPENWPHVSFKNGRSHTVPAEIDDGEEGYFIVSYNSTDFVAELRNKESSDYEWRKMWKASCNDSYKENRISVTNEAFGFANVCNNTTISCWRSNKRGEMKINTQFSLDHGYKVKLPSVYNTRNGEILLAVRKFTDEDCQAHDVFRMFKVDNDGEIASLELQFDTKCNHTNNIASIKLFENKEDQFCIARWCKSKDGKPAQLETSVQCYSKDGFSKCLDCL